MTNKKTKCAEAKMMIRKPVEEVFEAFMNPAITQNFWLQRVPAGWKLIKK